MHDETAIRRLVARLRQERQNLSKELNDFAELDRVTDPDDKRFDPQERDRLKSFAQFRIENIVHLLRALLRSEPMLTELRTAFEKELPAKLLKYKFRREDDGEPYFDFSAQNVVDRFFDLGVAALGGVISAERLAIVDAICGGLGETVACFVGRGWMTPPDREEPIKALGFQLLRAAFPDTEPDGHIVFKLADGGSRRPDAAIPSLRLCVEFKYANDAAQLGRCVDELVADMSAYGDPRYDLFRAVVFAPYAGASQDTLETLVRERMKNVHLRGEWKVFLTKAPGGRTRRRGGRPRVG
jgi:hypothetical protein